MFFGDVGLPLIKCDYAERIGTSERRNDMTGAMMRTLLRVLLAGLGVSAGADRPFDRRGGGASVRRPERLARAG